MRPHSTTASRAILMPAKPPLPAAAASTWLVDPHVLTWRFGNELIAYHLTTGRPYRLPGLPVQVREFLEIGGELRVPAPGGAARAPQDAPDLGGLLESLEQEQLVVRVGEGAKSASPQDKEGDLFLIIAADKAGPREVGPRETPAAVLSVGTVLQRAPRVTVELVGNRTRVSPGESQGPPISGGAFALRLLDAFERPRTVQEVIRVLQGRVREVQGWVGLIEALVRFYEGGVLGVVRQNVSTEHGAPTGQGH